MHLSLSLYIYIYICSLYVYIYIYIYIHIRGNHSSNATSLTHRCSSNTAKAAAT